MFRNWQVGRHDARNLQHGIEVTPVAAETAVGLGHEQQGKPAASTGAIPAVAASANTALAVSHSISRAALIAGPIRVR